ncbi:MAG: insulinase family protein, partial [Gammaproteobacteria bacterium]|nr:insulinase family protein [Gammaproteobacteria bacterium]
RDVVERSRFDEAPRIRELVAQIRARREQSVTGSGHSLAMGAAAQGLSPTAALSFRTGGLASIRAIKLLDQALREPAELDALCQRLGALHQRITGATPQFLAVAEPEHLDAVVAGMRACWPDMSARVAPTFALPPVAEVTREAWLTNTQVNFCAMAFPTVAVDHPDAAALTVLGGFLRNGYLHRAIREQGGAYGGGASQDSIQGAFRFYSYRDPRLEETLDDFTRALHWLMDTRHEVLALEEAILGVIGQLDKPRSPAGEAKHHFHGRLFGRDAAQRQRFRERVLGVTLDDLRRVTQAWLVPERASTAVITAPSERARVEQRGLVIQEL